MGHWFIRWLTFTYGVHLFAQVAAVQGGLWLFGYEISEWLKTNRPLVVLVICIHFVCYVIAKLASVEKDHLDALVRERLKDD